MILIVSHDAGGAEVVSSWVRRHPEYQFEFCLDGPAVEIFKRKIGTIDNQSVNNLNMLAQKLRGFQDCDAPKIFRHFVKGKANITLKNG